MESRRAEGDERCIHGTHGASPFCFLPLKRTRSVQRRHQHAELYDILYDAATRAGAQIRYNSEVVEIDASEREVTLASGENVSGDVLVGADGEFGPSRAAVIGQQVRGAPTGLAMYE